MDSKIVIYQLLPRLFGNLHTMSIPDGTIEENGCGRFNDISYKVLTELKSTGYTHIWLTGIIRHATGTDYSYLGLPASHSGILKGRAGSPYAINDYYDVDPDLASDVTRRMEEFTALVGRIHEKGLKVIIDFVPNHVARDYHSRLKPPGVKDLGEGDDTGMAFSPLNNYYYLPGEPLLLDGYAENPAKATGNDIFRPDPSPTDWYETVKINYGVDYRDGSTHFHPVPDTWIKMTEILRFWAAKGIDGFRCDMAGMVPVPFWTYAIREIRSIYPDLTFIAEIYEPARYEEFIITGGFDYLYDKIGLYDTLREVMTGQSPTRAISGVWQSLGGLDNKMLRFLENHDEQRIASKEFAGGPWKGLPGLAVAAFMNSGPLMIYAGQEFGEPADPATGALCVKGRTTIFDYTFIPAVQEWLIGKLNAAQKDHYEACRLILETAHRHEVFTEGYFYDLMYCNDDRAESGSIYTFLRYLPDLVYNLGKPGSVSVVLITVSFDPEIRSTRIRIPEHALQTIGIADKNRLLISGIAPVGQNPVQLLISQAVSSGIPVEFGSCGWSGLIIN